MYRNSFDTPLLLILAFRGLSFSFVVYGLQLLVKVWFVFIVLALEVPGLLRWFTSTFLVVLPYLFLCTYHLPKRHMMSDFLYSFISCCIHYSFQRDIFIPSVFVFFYTVANKHQFCLKPFSPQDYLFETDVSKYVWQQEWHNPVYVRRVDSSSLVFESFITPILIYKSCL